VGQRGTFCWWRRGRTVLLALAVAVSGFTTLPHAAVAAPEVGGQLFSSGGAVEVQVLEATAGLTSELWLFEPGPPRMLATNREVGRVVPLGSFPSGAELVFGIKVGGHEFRMGPADRNPDGIVHATVEFLDQGRAVVGFEDLYGGGDLDYDDNRFEFRGAIVPEPPNDPPVADAGPDQKVQEGEVVTLEGKATPAGESDPQAPAPDGRVELLPYQAPGYRYKVVPWGAIPEFAERSFDDADFADGAGAFGSGSCGLPGINTAWPDSTDVLLRRNVPVPAGASDIRVRVAIDNDVEVWWNGTRIGSHTSEFCAQLDAVVFVVPAELATVGNNLLAVRGHDRGTDTYLDVAVSAQVSPPEDSLRSRWELVESTGPTPRLTAPTTLTPSFRALDDGRYTFRLTVTDGQQTATDETTVTVDNADPEVGARAAPTATDRLAMVRASVTDRGVIDTHGATVDWGDGSDPQKVPGLVQGTGWGLVQAAHTYPADGTYQVKVTIADDDGGTATTQTEVEVGTAGPPGGTDRVALWANGTTDTALWVRGASKQVVGGLTHANGGIDVAGSRMRFHGGTEYATSLRVRGKGHQFDPAPARVPAAGYPIRFEVADYQPGGRAAKAAAAKDRFFDKTASCRPSDDDDEDDHDRDHDDDNRHHRERRSPSSTQRALSWTPRGMLASGLYWAPCAVHLTRHVTARGPITIVAAEAITVTGRTQAFEPFIDGLQFLSASTSRKAIRIAGTQGSFGGYLHAPTGGVKVTGGGHDFRCGILADTIRLAGGPALLHVADCPFAGEKGLSDGIEVAAPPSLLPTLKSELGVEPNPVLPTGELGFQATVTNTGATLIAPGLLAVTNTGTTPLQVTGVSYALEYFDTDQQAWIPLVSSGQPGDAVQVLGTPTPTSGVTYPPDHQLTGAQIAPEATGLWAAAAVLRLTPDQVNLLLNGANVGGIRNRLLVTTNQDAVARQTVRFGADLLAALRSASGDVTDTDLELVLPGADPETIGLGRLTPGASAQASRTVTTPGPTERAEGESVADYLARLESLDGSNLTGAAFAAGKGSLGPVLSVQNLATSALRLPAIRLAVDGPQAVTAGQTATWTFKLTNAGSAPASDLDLRFALDGTAVATSDLPATLAPGESVEATVRSEVPADRTQPIDTAATLTWTDSQQHRYGPVTDTSRVRVLTPAALQAIKQADATGDPEQAAYTITVRNSGDHPATGVIVADTPDPAARLVPGSLTSTAGTITDGNDPGDTTIGVDLGGLAAHALVTIRYRIDTSSTPTGTLLTNQATVTADGGLRVESDDPTRPGAADPTRWTVGDDEGGGGGEPQPGPTVSRVSPAEGDTVTTPTPVTATITPREGETITRWRVTARPANTPAGTAEELARGTGTPPDTLARFDPTTRANGAWVIAVAATGSGHGTTTAETNVIVDGRLKLGRLGVTYQDLNVPMAGIPIQVLRSYDTLNRSTSGEFGYGWRLEVANFRVASNGPLGQGGWEQYACGPGVIFVPLCYRTSRPHYVAVTWPDGRVETFDFTPEGLNTFFPIGAIPAYTARPGTTSTLTPAPGDSDASWGGDGNINAGGFGGGGVYNPTRWVLTAKDDTRYLLDVRSGLVEATDRNHNTLTIRADGIFASAGPDVTFERDAAGRITKLTDPNNKPIVYRYDAAGDLVSVTDQNGHTTTHGYQPGHFLAETKGERGPPLRAYRYDSDGRLESVTDAEGNLTRVEVDLGDRTETVVGPDPRLTTITSYSELGDPISTRRIAGGATITTAATFDSQGHRTSRTDGLGRTWRAEYDEDGNLTKVTDPAGGATTIAYDEFASPTAITEATGAVTRFGYDDRGNLAEVTDAAGHTRTFTYDDRGNPVTETDPTGAVTRREYDADGRVSRITDPEGRAATYSYDDNGNLATITDPLGHTTRHTYDAVGNLTATIDPLDRRTQWRYDDRDRVVAKTDAAGHTTSYTYDEVGNLTRQTDPLERATTYAYDQANQLVRQVDPAGAATSYTYDGFGRLTDQEDPIGRVTSYDYDAADQRTEMTLPNGGRHTYTYDALGNQTSDTDPLGRKTTRTWDAAGRLTSQTDPLDRTTTYELDTLGRPVKVTDPLGQATETTYDPAGRIATTTDPEGATTSYAYDKAGRRTASTDPLDRTTTFAYDPAGQLVAVTDPAGHTSRRTYDAAGQLTTTVEPSGKTTNYTHDALGHLTRITDPLDHATVSVYDPAGQLVRSVDANGNSTTSTYDPAGRLATLTDALGGQVRFTYDAAGQQTKIVNPRGDTTTYTYDQLGNLATETSPAGHTTHHSYDLAGQLIRRVDGRGIAATFTYDAAGQLRSRAYPDATTSFTYDAARQRATMTDPTGTTRYQYDRAGRTTSVSAPAGTVTYSYDPAGQRQTMTLPRNRRLTYTYDPAGLLSKITDWRDQAITFTYDPDGRRTTIDRPNGVHSSFAYDAAGRLTGIDHARDGASLTSYQYALDGAGNRVAVTSPAGTERYELDALNRLTKATYPGGDTTSYTYDPAGNRLTKSANGETTSYDYNPAGQLVSDGTRIYRYDEAGNLVAAGTDTFTWDDAGHLTSATVDGIRTVHRNDGDDLRVSSEAAGRTTPYLWDRQGDPPTLVDDGSRAYVHDDGLLAQIEGDVATHPLNDALGSIRAISNAAGALAGTADYDTFGLARRQDGARSIFGFTGELTGSTGLIYLRARYLDPSVGRFLSPDSVQPGAPGTQGYNLYAYVANNPTTFSDPSGRMSEAAVLNSHSYQRTQAATGPTSWSVRKVLLYVGTAISAAVVGCFAANVCDQKDDKSNPPPQPQPPEPNPKVDSPPTTQPYTLPEPLPSRDGKKQKEKDGRRAAMLLQVQWNTNHGGPTFTDPPAPEAPWDQGVTTVQAIAKLWAAVERVKPRKAKDLAKPAAAAAMAWIKQRPPYGVGPEENSWDFPFLRFSEPYRGYMDSRIDVVNKRGHNLKI
jgi:RHS repeat-associated protein/uncharacterized repeat protein (TIGR01451 family)